MVDDFGVDEKLRDIGEALRRQAQRVGDFADGLSAALGTNDQSATVLYDVKRALDAWTDIVLDVRGRAAKLAEARDGAAAAFVGCKQELEVLTEKCAIALDEERRKYKAKMAEALNWETTLGERRAEERAIASD